MPPSRRLPFQRFLSPVALDRARTLNSLVKEWASTPGSTAHLRRGDEVAFYHLGHRAMAISGLGGPAELVATFKNEAAEFVDESALLEHLRDARRRIQAHLEATDDEDKELAAQGRLLGQLAQAGSDFLLVDEQVMIPRVALLAPQAADTRVDALALHRGTGALWLLEIKLAASNDLDGPLLDQLVRTAALPDLIRGGEAFLAHYREVIRQKQVLGLLPEVVPDAVGPHVTAAVAIGSRPVALGRIACWERSAVPPGLRLAVLEAGEAMCSSAFSSLEIWLERSTEEEREPHVPRKPRWNAFTEQEDAAQADWRLGCPSAGQLGPLAPRLESCLGAHDAPRHKELHHARSSQAACLQLFAPLLGPDKDEGAERALLEVLEARFFAPRNMTLEEITEVHFEAPHGRRCLPPDSACTAAARMDALVGERCTVTTRLDALLRIRAKHAGGSTEALVGVEFKYTEAEFGACGGFNSAGIAREDRAACLSGQVRAEACYLRGHENRKYLGAEGLVRLFGRDVLDDPGPCAFVGGTNQLLRGHFTTLRLADLSGAMPAYLVIHDARNEELTGPERPVPGAPAASGLSPLERYRGLLRPELAPTFGSLTAQDVVAGYLAQAPAGRPPEWLTALQARYRW